MAGKHESFDFDVLVIGSGFGGSVTALRLTEKGYRVGVIEAGARFEDDDFPDTSCDVKKYLFAPAVGCYGIQRIDMVKDCMIVSGAGVGGGSLVYANTLYEPLDAFYRDPSWAHITDWKSELAPYYDQAKRMLGVVEYPLRTPADEVMQKVADDMGVDDTFHPTPVGVFFGGPGQTSDDVVADPYFGGAGPDRNPCRNCGECMTGCRHNSKNTLVKNYLYLAEQAGARRAPADHGHPGRPARGRRLRGRHPVHQGQALAAHGDQDVHRRAGHLLGGRARHPAAAAQAEGRGRPAPDLRPARGADPDQLRVDPRCDRPRPRASTTPRASRSPRRSTPTSTPTSSRSATARAATSCR